jgi:hypothetical protein
MVNLATAEWTPDRSVPILDLSVGGLLRATVARAPDAVALASRMYIVHLHIHTASTPNLSQALVSAIPASAVDSAGPARAVEDGLEALKTGRPGPA